MGTPAYDAPWHHVRMQMAFADAKALLHPQKNFWTAASAKAICICSHLHLICIHKSAFASAIEFSHSRKRTLCTRERSLFIRIRDLPRGTSIKRATDKRGYLYQDRHPRGTSKMSVLIGVPRATYICPTARYLYQDRHPQTSPVYLQKIFVLAQKSPPARCLYLKSHIHSIQYHKITLSKELYISAKEPYAFTKTQITSAKEPHRREVTLSKEPCISTTLYVTAKECYMRAKRDLCMATVSRIE